jgi:predicted O-methyltransferase YrrM
MVHSLKQNIKRRLKRLIILMAPPRGACGSFYSDASLMRPEREMQSAWIEHAPFAFWLVQTQRPRTIVELGTYAGYSYLCFCQAVKNFAYAAQTFAIDTWEGDEHAGFYGAELLRELHSYHDPRYSEFSTLIRATFDDALDHFTDGSIDLLHIDGRHRYEDVRHDFETWQPKLSDRAVVLFHDTQERKGDFGVFRFWSEISANVPSFEFWHGHGLGVLGCGFNIPSKISMLLNLPADGEVARSVRDLYRRLGAVC